MSKNGSSTTSPTKFAASANINLFQEIVIRLMLFGLYVYFEVKEPFVRLIHPEEWWLYKNPVTPSYVPLSLLYPSVFGLVGVVFIGYYIRSRHFQDFKCAWLGFSLACTLNGAITDVVKVAVGRPRPDFFYRCFPDGLVNAEFVCTGDSVTIKDGRKSFPSGHSSFAFASLGFLAWYLFAKLLVFTNRGRGQSCRLLMGMSPLFAALLIAISRTCDYHHHWQDVAVGSLIGLVIGYLSYRQYYPAIDSRFCYLPYCGEFLTINSNRKLASEKDELINDSELETNSLVEGEEKDNKWT